MRHLLTRPLAAFLIAVAMSMTGCGPRIGGYDRFEIADAIAEEQGVARAESWLDEQYGPDTAREWRRNYEQEHGTATESAGTDSEPDE